ncbi:MAG TPA: hypothetical protein VFO25_08255 [Candidatus Eremiobacteraceae bacterium]|nr:hypothetical protein [Candidatus Eremiobacteraceae bacterium]
MTIYYIDPNNQPSGSTLELYDGTTGMSVCSSSRILYSSGQIGAGFVYHDAPIKFTQGLEYKLVSGTAPTSPDGFRFRVLP